MSEIVRWEFSEHASNHEIEYREQLDPVRYSRERLIEKWTKKKVAQHLQEVMNVTGIKISGNIAELGAGSCWMSSLVSRFEAVDSIHAIELSRRRLEEMAPVAFDYFDAERKKITLVEGDFNKTQLSDNSMDYALASGCIHHAPDLEAVFTEAYRFLKPEGKFIFFRENEKPMLRKISSKYTKQGNRWASHIDYFYTKGQYLSALRNSGLSAAAISYNPDFQSSSVWLASLKRSIPLKYLNGWYFCSNIYVGTKPVG